ALLMAAGFAASAQAGEVKVLNKDTWFAEGPIWYQNKLFYVEYGRHTVMTWDGQKNEVFWKTAAGHPRFCPMPAAISWSPAMIRTRSRAYRRTARRSIRIRRTTTVIRSSGRMTLHRTRRAEFILPAPAKVGR